MIWVKLDLAHQSLITVLPETPESNQPPKEYRADALSTRLTEPLHTALLFRGKRKRKFLWNFRSCIKVFWMNCSFFRGPKLQNVSFMAFNAMRKGRIHQQVPMQDLTGRMNCLAHKAEPRDYPGKINPCAERVSSNETAEKVHTAEGGIVGSRAGPIRCLDQQCDGHHESEAPRTPEETLHQGF
uniref:Uncharacterized protein n=1 Tax=Bursaphelenchus xylophilus TaxID=6326 RepID=A0A1I7SE35_BURXY